MGEHMTAEGPRIVERFPGAGSNPFADDPDQQAVFFGRDAEIQRLVDTIAASRLTVLYGVSGRGKTSLLTGGLFPRLRKEGWLPVYVRLEETTAPATLVIPALREAARHDGAEVVGGDESGLWEFLTSCLVWRGEAALTPVLVFDQFEEIFGLSRPCREAIAGEIGALESGVVPERLRGEDAAGAARQRARQRPRDLRIVLSLREEDFGSLQELSPLIPGLFQERLRLTPLGREQAREAIQRPAALQAPPSEGARFATPPFEFDPQALDDVLTFLEGESNEIEAWEVQQVCADTERNIVAARRPAGGNVRVGRADLQGGGALGTMLLGYYRKALAGIRPARQRRRARRVCEEGLLTAAGRRVTCEASQLRRDYGISEQTLKVLDAKHVIRHVHRLGGLHYELTHDRLAEAISAARPWWRIPRQFRVAAVVALGALAAVAAVFVHDLRKVEAARDDAEELVAFLIGRDFLEQLRFVGRLELLDQVQERVSGYSEQGFDDPRHQRTQGLARLNAGDLLREKGDLPGAAEAYRQALQAFDRLRTRNGADPQADVDAARAQRSLGVVLAEQGKPTPALEQLREALAQVSRVLESHPDHLPAMVEEAQIHGAMGQVLLARGEATAALGHFETVLRAWPRLQLAAEAGAATRQAREARMVLHAGLDGRAAAFAALGREGALSLYFESRHVMDELRDKYPRAPDVQIELADAKVRLLEHITRVVDALGDAKVAKGYHMQLAEAYKGILAELEEFVSWDGANARWKRQRAVARSLVAGSDRAAGRLDAALEGYREAREWMEELIRKDGSNAAWKEGLAFLLLSRGRTLEQVGDARKAAEAYASALGLLREVADLDAGNARTRSLLGEALLRLGESEGVSPQERLDRSREARRLLSRLGFAHLDNVQFGRQVAAAYQAEARALDRLRLDQERKAALAEGGRVLAALRWASPHLDATLAVDDLREQRSAEGTASPNPLGGRQDAIDRLEQAVGRSSGDPWFPSKLAEARANLAQAQLEAGRTDDAASSCNRARVAAEQATDMGSDAVEPWRALALALTCQARVFTRRGDLEGAAQAYAEALGAHRKAVGMMPWLLEPRRGLLACDRERYRATEAKRGSEAAMNACQEWVDDAQSADAVHPDKTDFATSLSQALAARGRVQEGLGKREAALASYQEALAAAERVNKADPRAVREVAANELRRDVKRLSGPRLHGIR